ncbi:MAG: DUF4404 family protein [Ectothiorhodospiraceae bacterium]|nr:DUF4404 family protein [Ectothiorhodospiraceae bacterium]
MDEKLHETLEALRAEIARLEGRDPRARGRLEALVEDIERRIAEPDDVEHHENLIDGLREAIDQFEVEHPRATGLLNHVMVTLANMGI